MVATIFVRLSMPQGYRLVVPKSGDSPGILLGFLCQCGITVASYSTVLHPSRYYVTNSGNHIRENSPALSSSKSRMTSPHSSTTYIDTTIR